MSEKRKVLFIINPVSGVGKKDKLPSLFNNKLSRLFNVDIAYTQAPLHAIELSRQAAANGYYAVFAVGGDGSVNEVAQGLLNTNTFLGIIPAGSGNGLARHLRISMKPQTALKSLLNGNYVMLDVGKINERYFVGTCGIGFDALIAEKFWRLNKRGLVSYVRIITKEFLSYSGVKFHLQSENQNIHDSAFILSIANGSQFGNQATIAPGAHASDGFLELCKITKFPWWRTPFVAIRMLSGTLNGASYYERKIVKKVTIEGNFNYFHADGEPFKCDGRVNIEVIPGALKVLAPNFN